MRQLCPRCKQAAPPDPRLLASAGLDESRVSGRTIYAPKGCDDCNRTGFRGRFGIYELFEMSPEVREATFRKEPTFRLRELARTTGGMTSLRDDAIRKVLAGQTSLDEVMRVLSKEAVGVEEGAA
jgi:type II secretory ATPase GspE/PulE/Tfp pilus assembly ATPase PilB-like protein